MTTKRAPFIYTRLDGKAARYQPTEESDLQISTREDHGVSIVGVYVTRTGRAIARYNSIWARSDGTTRGEYAEELDTNTIAEYAQRFDSRELADLIPLDND
jgi:hypothetical protein